MILNARNLQCFSALEALASIACATSVAGPDGSQAAAPLPIPAQKASESSWIPLKKPAWLTELSVGVRETYDNNVFISPVYKNSTTGDFSRTGPVEEMQASFITTVTPRIIVNLVPVLGDQQLLQGFSLGYTPEFAIFHDEPSENNAQHRLTTGLKGKSGAFSFSLDNALTCVDGSMDALQYPVLPGYGTSAYTTSTIRDRREQFVDRAKVALQYNLGKWFLRPASSLIYCDFLTHQRPVVGYQNYADRYDLNGGIDVGYKLQPKFYATLGYRYGHQEQEQFSQAIERGNFSSPNDYQRVLAGIEGNPWPWLALAFQIGPDFRTYAGNTPTHTTPVGDLNQLKFYGEGSATAEVTPQDTLALKYKQWQWVVSTGRIPYYETQVELSYRHKLSAKLQVDVAGRASNSDYTSGNISSALRNDWMFTPSVGLRYSFNASFAVDAAYSYDFGRNYQDMPLRPTREFDRQLASIGALFKF